MKKKINWYEIVSPKGYHVDELVSALQKDIRRSKVDQACFWAYEMFTTGDEQVCRKLWKRLKVIAIEDIWPHKVEKALPLIKQLEELSNLVEKEGDSLMCLFTAVYYLSMAEKDRFFDEYKNFLIKDFENKKIKMPDYAIDKHTFKGKKLNKGEKDFWLEGAKIEPEVTGRNKFYLKKILEVFSNEEDN